MPGITTWPTNTKFKVSPVVKQRYRSNTVGADYEVDAALQPRLLQPVTNDTALTVANGFTTANLRPGDMILIDDGTGGIPQLLIRNGANNGWSVIKYDDTLADA